MCCSLKTFIVLAPWLVAYIGSVAYDPVISFSRIGNGYGSKLACSIIFGAGRDLSSPLGAEFVFPPVKYFREFDVDEKSKCVTVSDWREASTQKACWRGRRTGCHLVPSENENMFEVPSNINAPLSPDEQTANDARPWPLGGDAQADPESVAAAKIGVDMNAIDKAVTAHFDRDELHARGFLLVKNGQIIYEKYREKDGFTKDSKLHGWSMTKSLLAALISARIKDGKLSLDTPAGDYIEEWKHQPDLNKITVGQMLQMSDGLDLDEIYNPGSDVTNMLFLGSGLDKVIADAKLRVDANASSCFQYSSMTTNILCKMLKATFPEDDSLGQYLAYPTKAIFEPLGTSSFVLESDPTGIFQGSSFGWATTRDWARLGLLFLYDGMWWPETSTSPTLAARTEQVLSTNFSKFVQTPASTSRNVYGGHFWLGGGNRTDAAGGDAELARADECDGLFKTRLTPPKDWLYTAFPPGTFLMGGFESQNVVIQPELDVVLVRLGATKEVVLKWDKEGFYKTIFAALQSSKE